jgi:hypothetical protein
VTYQQKFGKQIVQHVAQLNQDQSLRSLLLLSKEDEDIRDKVLDEAKDKRMTENGQYIGHLPMSSTRAHCPNPKSARDCPRPSPGSSGPGDFVTDPVRCSYGARRCGGPASTITSDPWGGTTASAAGGF